MLSGLRTLHLPNLELRDAALAARAALSLSARGVDEVGRVVSSCEQGEEKVIEGRKRSKSLGDARERYSGVNGSETAAKISVLHRDAIGRMSTGISLCLVDDENDTTEPSNGKMRYDSTGQHPNLIDADTVEEGEVDATLKQSQSCTISNLGIESPPISPRVSPTKASDDNVDNTKDEEDTKQTPFISILYGVVNTSIILPVLMSFGSIIYHHDFFRPYLSTLMKLTVLSGAVHQITFSSVSSLPFAVGQVQDAGLIFLSSMSRDLVKQLQSRGEDADVILATVCVGLSLSTAILGLALILVGKFRLASYMQMLPSSVVGGYLVCRYET